ncbi:MAG: hypothetical protein IPN29_02000 [Saprospiraceae bacterium]|nr:hypothetical protein [Saprospiraceae bacterium]
MNIIILKDMPERGRHWTKGKIVYGIDPEHFKAYFESGHIKGIDVKEPIWKAKNEDEEE